MKRRSIILIALGAVVLPFAVFFASIHTDYSFACVYTCSHKGHRGWIFGLKSGEWYEPSPIEQRLGAGLIKHQWVSYAGTSKGLFGNVIGYGHGRPHRAALFKEYWPYFESLSDAEIQSLFEAFQKLDGKALEAFIDELETRMSEYMENQPLP